MNVPLLKLGQELTIFSKKKSKRSYQTGEPGSSLVTPAEFSVHQNMLDIPSVVIIEALPQDQEPSSDTPTSVTENDAAQLGSVHIPINDLASRQLAPILISDQPLSTGTKLKEKSGLWEPVFGFTKTTTEKKRQVQFV